MPNPFDQFDAAQANPFDQFDPAVNPSARSPAAQPLDIAKQAGFGLTEGLAGLPFSGPQLFKQIGDVVGEKFGLPKAEPIINAPPTPTEALAAALPPPQNESEATARNLGQYGASVFPGARNHLLENIGGALGAAGGAYFGPQVAPYFGATPDQGAITGAIAGGLTGAKTAGVQANRVARNLMPGSQEVLNAASDTYDALRQSNKAIVVPRDAMSIVKNGVLSVLKSQGPAEEDAKEVYGIIKGLDTDSGGTVADILNARKNLTGHFQGGPDANKPAAILALQVIDPLIDRIAAPGTLAKLKEADANWSAARTAQAVDTKISQAEDRAEGANSGMNTGNNIIQNINAYIKSRTDNIGKVHMAPSDLGALNQVRKLDIGQQATRMLAGAAGGGGGRDITASALLGMGGAFGLNQAGANLTEGGDPLIGGVGLPILGLIARHGFNSSVARAAKNAESQILARAPYVQSLGLRAPQPLLSGPQVASRSLIFAAPAIRDEFAGSAQ